MTGAEGHRGSGLDSFLFRWLGCFRGKAPARNRRNGARRNGAGPSIRRYLVKVLGIVEVKFDALAKSGFGAPESSSDLGQAGDAQNQGLMRHPGAGMCQRAMATGGNQCGPVGGKLLAGFVDEHVECLV